MFKRYCLLLELSLGLKIRNIYIVCGGENNALVKVPLCLQCTLSTHCNLRPQKFYRFSKFGNLSIIDIKGVFSKIKDGVG